VLHAWENLRNPARKRSAGAMRQLLSGQLDSTRTKFSTLYTMQKYRGIKSYTAASYPR
jgi:hypothetical protein